MLTCREQEVLGLMLQGKTSIEIGRLLFISINTVRNHRASILKKLKVRNTTELIIKVFSDR